jgi:hypothetical protein
MSTGRSRWYLVLKCALAGVILVAVGWKFNDLLRAPELAQRATVRVGYLIPAGLLYLVCHTLWGTFWWQLLRGQGVTVSWFVAVRAYFVSQFGKYVPGKAWTLLLRVGLMKGVDVRPTAVLVTGAYDTLTNMAAGALLGVCLLPWSGLASELSELQQYGLFGLILLPLGLLGLNRLIRRVAKRYRGPDAPVIPVPSPLLLARGMIQGMFGWGLLGLSLWLTACGLCAEPPPLTGSAYLQYLSGVCISYVLGFIVLVAPAGAGVREWVLLKVLERQLAVNEGAAAGAVAAAIAIGLRIVWTAFEVVCAMGLYLISLSPKGEGLGVKGRNHGEHPPTPNPTASGERGASQEVPL